MHARSALVASALVISSLSTATLAGEIAIAPVISDRNSSATFNLTGDTAGMNFWQLDQTPRLKLQGFWYRTAGMTREQNIGTLALTGAQLSDTNPFIDNRPDTLALRYAQPNNAFFIDPTWKVAGGSSGSGVADILETIRITNNSRSQPLVISFFQYADFDLSGYGQDAPLPDVSVSIDSVLNNTANQSGTDFALTETVVTPRPSRYQVGLASALLGGLNDNEVTDLNNNGGPTGPGDLAWAFQWDFVIPAGLSVTINKDKSIVPTPGATTLFAIGGVLAASRRRRTSI